jgi:hypothetical protein
VRSAYRKKVAIWHPDRLPDIEGIRESAEAKFKEVSGAYQAISSYYNETGMMPEVDLFEVRVDEYANDGVPPMEQVYDYESYEPPPRPKKRRRISITWLVMVVLTVFFTVYLLSIQSWDERSAADLEAVLEQQRSSQPALPVEPLLPREAVGEKVRNTLRVRKGMSKDVVLQIQGEPILMNGDTWDYGISKIYFRNELVSGWYSSPLDPLKVE